MSIRTVRHVGIVVSDISRSLRFYRDLLAMEVWADFLESSPFTESLTNVRGAKQHVIKLKAADGTSIELIQYLSHPQEVPAPRKSCDVGCNHLCLAVDDIDAVHERLKSSGTEFNCEPKVSPDGGGKVAYYRDPEGVIVELVQLLTLSERS